MYVCIAACVLGIDDVIAWRSMRYDAIISTPCTILLSKYTTLDCNVNDRSARSLNVWNGCRFGPKRTEGVIYWCLI